MKKSEEEQFSDRNEKQDAPTVQRSVKAHNGYLPEKDKARGSVSFREHRWERQGQERPSASRGYNACGKAKQEE